jgi:hypothetical protein
MSWKGEFMRTRLYIAILSVCLLAVSLGGAAATWKYASGSVEPGHADLSIQIEKFSYVPKGEVDIIQRLYDILNRIYEVPGIDDVRAYLLTHINSTWQDGHTDPYIGNMYQEYFDAQLGILFEDVMQEGVNFILKNEDLNDDGYNEIALYTTSDPLDSLSEWPSNIVCVHVSVFTPILDDQNQVVRYDLVCKTLRGYAGEVRYSQDIDYVASFSTDSWRNDVGYQYWDEAIGSSSPALPIPDTAVGSDGVTPYKYDFWSYNTSYVPAPGIWGWTVCYGATLDECLADEFAKLN